MEISKYILLFFSYILFLSWMMYFLDLSRESFLIEKAMMIYIFIYSSYCFFRDYMYEYIETFYDKYIKKEEPQTTDLSTLQESQTPDESGCNEEEKETMDENTTSKENKED